MNLNEAKIEAKKLFAEGLTSPQVKERLEQSGISKEAANAIALQIINDDMVAEEAQENYKSTLIYGLIATTVGLASIILTWSRPDINIPRVRWVTILGLGLLFTGCRKWKVATKD